MPWSRASQEGNEKIPNNAVNQREQEPKPERKRNTPKIDSEGERNFQINSRDEINVQACKWEQSYNSSGDPQEKSNVVRACV